MTTASKTELRKAARARRAALADPDFAFAIVPYAEDLGLAPGATVGGYQAHRGEADPDQLLERLIDLGCFVAFPRVVARDTPLEFHHVPDSEVLEPGNYGIREPLAHWPVARPGLLLVPLLAFDRHGTRLGTGGGFYDRTLMKLNAGASRKTRAVGIAYAGQEVDFLPRDAHDYPLDAVLTEDGLRSFLQQRS